LIYLYKERLLNKGLWPSRCTASKDEKRQDLQPKLLIKKDLFVTHLVTVLKGTQVLYKESSLALFQVIKAKEGFRYLLGRKLIHVSMLKIPLVRIACTHMFVYFI
jgi:hypothetical protein